MCRTKAEAKDSRFDLVKWLVVAALVVVAVVGNQY
ncbi:MAG TPA: preprotein translocase subunit SecE, partial [Pseudomonas sp.]|nr:preprotein translocase subunit SecE [Pseudomonas sp.]